MTSSEKIKFLLRTTNQNPGAGTSSQTPTWWHASQPGRYDNTGRYGNSPKTTNTTHRTKVAT